MRGRSYRLERRAVVPEVIQYVVAHLDGQSQWCADHVRAVESRLLNICVDKIIPDNEQYNR